MAANRKNYRSHRAGVTLLELILALALSVIILTAIGMAINLHFKMVDVRRTSLEEMQVVRVVTLRMTNDIRMLVQPNKPDLSGLETTFANAMQAATKQATAAAEGAGIVIGGSGDSGGQNQSGGGQNQGGQNQGGGAGGQSGSGQQQGNNSSQQGGGQQGGGQGGQQSGGGAANASKTGGGQSGQSAGTSQAANSAGGQTGGGATGQTDSSAQGGSSGAQSSSTGSTAASATPAAPAVQLIGSAYELRFDISRLPRVDQYAGIMAKGGELSAIDLPSDVKTIAYYLRSQQAADAVANDPNVVGGEASTDGTGRGLMRAEMDRAVTSWAELAGAEDSIYSNAQLLADEVVYLDFQYFDGIEWLTEWDSTSSGTLPRAIRIGLSVQPTYGMSEQEVANSAAAGKAAAEQEFYFTVALPTAPLVAPPPATESTEATGASSSTGSTSATGQTSGATTQGTMP